MTPHTYVKNLLLIFLGGVFGVVVSTLWFTQNEASMVSSACFSDYQEVREVGHQYIKPLLECNAFVMAPGLESLRSEIETEFDSSKFGDRASLYFRDLNTGMWIGIREDQKIAPASLSKVLHLLAVYRKSEQDPKFLDEEFLYANQFLYLRNLDEVEYEGKLLENGQRYTVNDLVEKMITYSDNESSFALQYMLNKKYPKFIASLESDLNVDYIGTISLKDYSSMFRMLYNASYLNRVNSEKALTLLINANYKDGLVAGVPKEVTVASKFGFYDPLPSSEHDYRFNQCGIVYHPERPYLLCVSIPTQTMSEVWESIPYIESLSAKVFNWVDDNANDLSSELVKDFASK